MRSIWTSGLLMVLIVLPSRLSAQYRLPAPTGTHAIGTTILYLTDSARDEALTDTLGDHRRVAVKLWYPAQPLPGSEPAPYSPLYPEFNVVVTHGHEGAPFAELPAPCPVVLICPGRGTEMHYYTILAEDLASHGYVVAAIDMPFLGRVKFPDGTFIKASQRFKLPAGMMTDTVPYARVDSFFHEAAQLGLADVEFVIAQLGRLDEGEGSDLFNGRLDLSNMGIFGHSLGGRIAGLAAFRIPAIHAYAAMEGIAPPEARASGIPSPSLYMMSGSTPEHIVKNYRTVVPQRKNALRIMRIDGYGHNSLIDLALMDSASYSYPINSTEGLVIGRDVLRAWFDTCLLDNKDAMAGMLGRQQRVMCETFPRP